MIRPRCGQLVLSPSGSRDQMTKCAGISIVHSLIFVKRDSAAIRSYASAAVFSPPMTKTLQELVGAVIHNCGAWKYYIDNAIEEFAQDNSLVVG
jgi:hypothetical protein